MELEYRKVGDYYLPNIVVPEENIETKGKDIGKYGRLKLNFLKENNKVLYQELLLDNKLHEYLVKTDENANIKVKHLIEQLAEQENVNENLKATDQLEWVQRMNNIKNRAEEIGLKEIIYS
jgi:hypothetical protein